jgi:hypothetical protein
MFCPICGYKEGMKPRSLEQIKLYWVFLGLICEYQESPVFQGKMGTQNFHDTLKTALGYVDPIYDINGIIVSWKPKSISMEKMNSQEFCDYFDKVKNYVFSIIIPAAQREDFEKRVLELLKERGPND